MQKYHIEEFKDENGKYSFKQTPTQVKDDSNQSAYNKAFNIWKAQKKITGFFYKYPKRGSDDYNEIITIMKQQKKPVFMLSEAKGRSLVIDNKLIKKQKESDSDY